MAPRTTRASAAAAVSVSAPSSPSLPSTSRKRKQQPTTKADDAAPTRRTTRRSKSAGQEESSPSSHTHTDEPARKKRKSSEPQPVVASTRLTRAAAKKALPVQQPGVEQPSGIMPLSVVDVGPVGSSRPRSPTPVLQIPTASSPPPDSSGSPPPSPGSSTAGSPPLLPTALPAPTPMSPISLPVSSLPIPQPPPLQLEPQTMLGGEPDADGEMDESLMVAPGVSVLTTPPPQPPLNDDPMSRLLTKSAVPQNGSYLRWSFTADDAPDLPPIRRTKPPPPPKQVHHQPDQDPDYKYRNYPLYELACRARIQHTRRVVGIDVPGSAHKSLEPIKRLEEERTDAYWRSHGWPTDLPGGMGQGLLTRSPSPGPSKRLRSLTPMPTPVATPTPISTPHPPSPPPTKRRRLSVEQPVQGPPPPPVLERRITRSKLKSAQDEPKLKSKPTPPPSPRITRSTPSPKKPQPTPLPPTRRKSARLHKDSPPPQAADAEEEDQVEQDLIPISPTSAEKRKASWLDDDSSLSELSDSDKEDHSPPGTPMELVEDDESDSDEDDDMSLTESQKAEFDQLSTSGFLNSELSVSPLEPIPASPAPSESTLYIPILDIPVLDAISPQSLLSPSLDRPSFAPLNEIKVPGLQAMDLTPAKFQLGTIVDNRRRRVWSGREIPDSGLPPPQIPEPFKTGVLKQQPRKHNIGRTAQEVLSDYYPQHCLNAPPGWFEARRAQEEAAAAAAQQADGMHQHHAMYGAPPPVLGGFRDGNFNDPGSREEVATPAWEAIDVSSENAYPTAALLDMFGSGATNPEVGSYAFANPSHYDHNTSQQLMPDQWNGVDPAFGDFSSMGAGGMTGFEASSSHGWGAAGTSAYGAAGGDFLFSGTVSVSNDPSNWLPTPVGSSTGHSQATGLWAMQMQVPQQGGYSSAPSTTGGPAGATGGNSGSDSQLSFALGVNSMSG